MEVEGRPKTLKLRSGKEKELRSEFGKMCAKDPVLKSRLKTHYATFKSHHPKFGMDVEIDPSSIITDGTVVKVFFASYAPIVSVSHLQLVSDLPVQTNLANIFSGLYSYRCPIE